MTAAQQIKFSKYEGLGNDFIVLSLSDLVTPINSDLARAMCDRRRGVGADGILVVDDDKLEITIWNADGSHAAMCGNGVRCIALRHHEATGAQKFTIDTPVGPHACEITANGNVKVAMHPATFDLGNGKEKINLDYEGRTYNFYCIDVGNPHLVSFEGAAYALRAELGPYVEQNADEVAGCRGGANVEFVTFEEQEEEAYYLEVWERGAGWTQACGTGACAVVAAGVRHGISKPGENARVHLPGGTLEILYRGHGQPIDMIGSATHVFDGKLALR